MSELIDYIFVDEDFQVIEQAGLHDDEIAYQRAQRLANEKNQIITILEIKDNVTPCRG